MAATPFVFTQLSDDDRECLAALGAVALVALERGGCDMSAISGTKADLPILQHSFETGRFDLSDPDELDGLSVLFGDVLAYELGLRWVMASGPYGTSPVLRYQQTSIQLAVLQMIRRRVEEGPKVDLMALFTGLAALVEEMIASGQY